MSAECSSRPRPAIALRAASGAHIGLGHAMRCRAIAQALEEGGWSALVIADDRGTADALAAAGCSAVAEGADLEWAARPWKAAWLDGFRDWTVETAELQGHGARVVLAENRGPARERADHVVYPALHWAPDEWDTAHPERVRGGPQWIPLRREVSTLDPGERDIDLLITFGGADPRGLTERALEACAATARPRALRAVVVVGPWMRERTAPIAALARRLPGARLAAPEESLPALMARSKVALTALGTSLYELAYLGVPALILANYADDAPALEHYARSGPHLPLGIAGELDAAELARRVARGLDTPRLQAGSRPGSSCAGLRGILAGGAGRIAQLLAAA